MRLKWSQKLMQLYEDKVFLHYSDIDNFQPDNWRRFEI